MTIATNFDNDNNKKTNNNNNNTKETHKTSQNIIYQSYIDDY